MFMQFFSELLQLVLCEFRVVKVRFSKVLQFEEKKQSKFWKILPIRSSNSALAMEEYVRKKNARIVCIFYQLLMQLFAKK